MSYLSPPSSSKQSISPLTPLSPNSEPICSICLDNFTERVTYLNCCFHQFHHNCITDWSNVTNLCPLCKKRFKYIYTKEVNRLVRNEWQDIMKNRALKKKCHIERIATKHQSVDDDDEDEEDEEEIEQREEEKQQEEDYSRNRISRSQRVSRSAANRSASVVEMALEEVKIARENRYRSEQAANGTVQSNAHAQPTSSRRGRRRISEEETEEFTNSGAQNAAEEQHTQVQEDYNAQLLRAIDESLKDFRLHQQEQKQQQTIIGYDHTLQFPRTTATTTGTRPQQQQVTNRRKNNGRRKQQEEKEGCEQSRITSYFSSSSSSTSSSSHSSSSSSSSSSNISVQSSTKIQWMKSRDGKWIRARTGGDDIVEQKLAEVRELHKLKKEAEEKERERQQSSIKPSIHQIHCMEALDSFQQLIQQQKMKEQQILSTLPSLSSSSHSSSPYLSPTKSSSSFSSLNVNTRLTPHLPTTSRVTLQPLTDSPYTLSPLLNSGRVADKRNSDDFTTKHQSIDITSDREDDHKQDEDSDNGDYGIFENLTLEQRMEIRFNQANKENNSSAYRING